MLARVFALTIVATAVSSQSFATAPSSVDPKGCCSACHAADTVKRLDDGTLELTRGDVRIRVPRTFPFGVSTDGQARFCVWESGWGPEPRCVFLPADS
jgi:hypothetical protein